MSTRRADDAARDLLAAITDGEFPPRTELPPEQQLAERFGVSRLTVREGIRALAGHGVLSVRHGKRSLVNPPEQWSPLDAQVLRARGRLSGNALELPTQLVEARRAIEVEVARLAADRATDEDLTALAGTLEDMEKSRGDPGPRFAEADLAFHAGVVAAARNVYLAAAYRPLEQVLHVVRLETSRDPRIREHALSWHRRIFDAIRAHDAEGAARQMLGHMQQTQDDIAERVGGSAFR